MKKPTVSDIGEDKLVADLVAGLPWNEQVRVAAGDDCAVVGAPEDSHWTLLKTDCVIEGIHFASDAPPERIGWKAMARALSDIAAMGGQPQHALVTIALPGASEVAWLQALYQGLREVSGQFGVSIVGGETARSPGPIFLSIVLTGSVRADRCILRSGGKPGDALYVTGQLGGAADGHHLNFVPRLEQGQWLAGQGFVSCMMDLSDGLGSDLPRLAGASGCGFTIDRSLLPCRAGSNASGAISDGEDYELLFAVPADRAAALEQAWPARFPNLPLTRIGRLESPGASSPLAHGFDHFA